MSEATANSPRRVVSLAVLWIVCAFALWLSTYRPFTGSLGIAEKFPDQVGEFTVKEHHGIDAQQASLLGTDDAIWRTYEDAANNEVYLVLVFHRENWKSVHPPDICLRGSNMVLELDEQLDDAGRLTLHSRDQNVGYVSLYRYGGADLATGSYLSFFLHHAPRALFRAATDGYLLRVEAYEEPDRAAARARCRKFLDQAEPILAELMR